MIDSIHPPVDPERTEAVFVHDGREIDWYDPVYSIQEDNCAWYIEGTASVYRVQKDPGVALIVRYLEAPNV